MYKFTLAVTDTSRLPKRYFLKEAVSQNVLQPFLFFLQIHSASGFDFSETFGS